jgi:ADP-ribose pyrophosphatase YjhB (NUDIX family)
MIECTSIKGNKIRIPQDKLVFRPSVYAIIIHNGLILMHRNRTNGKYFFPGGGVRIGEKLADSLKREVKEETGINIKVGAFIYFKEQFFYYDPKDEAFQMLNFFYLCKPLTHKLLRDGEVNDEEAEHPRWLSLNVIKKDNENTDDTVKEILRLL